MKTVVHLLRHGEVHNPDRACSTAAARLPPLRPGPPDGQAGRGGHRRPRHHPGLRLARWSAPSRPAAAAGAPAASTSRPTSGSSSRPTSSRASPSASGRDAAQPEGLALPVEPVAALVGRALQAGRRPDDRRGPRRPATPAEGHEAVVVSHQLPIWITRLHLERRSFLHDPRKRQCTLCSLTSLTFEGERLLDDRLLRAGRRPHPGQGPPGARSPPAGPPTSVEPGARPSSDRRTPARAGRCAVALLGLRRVRRLRAQRRRPGVRERRRHGHRAGAVRA